jgi:hypothetical protein
VTLSMDEALCALQQPLVQQVPEVRPLIAWSTARAAEVVEQNPLFVAVHESGSGLGCATRPRPIADPDVCDGTSAVGESRHRIPGASERPLAATLAADVRGHRRSAEIQRQGHGELAREPAGFA